MVNIVGLFVGQTTQKLEHRRNVCFYGVNLVVEFGTLPNQPLKRRGERAGC